MSDFCCAEFQDFVAFLQSGVKDELKLLAVIGDDGFQEVRALVTDEGRYRARHGNR